MIPARRRTTPALSRLAATLPQRPKYKPAPQVDGKPTGQPPIREIIGAVLARVTDPPRFSQSRGIVTSAGGKVLLTNAYVLFRLLRYLGCTLSIECWQLPHERDEAWQRLVEPLGVTIVDARARGFVGNPFADGSRIHFLGDTSKMYRRDMLDGYALKAYALQWCDFRQALWLDADNCPVRNATECFDWPEFVHGKGVVLWPDPGHKGTAYARPIMKTFGLPELTETKTGDWLNGIETGQILVNKTLLHVWSALSLNNFFNENAQPFYGSSWGDKDTLNPSCRLVGFEPAIAPPSRVVDGCAMQRDFRGEAFLFHRFGEYAKWRMDGENAKPEGFPWQAECEGWLAELPTALRSPP